MLNGLDLPNTDFQKPMLVSDALAILRQAAIDGQIDVQMCFEIGREFHDFAFALQSASLEKTESNWRLSEKMP